MHEGEGEFDNDFVLDVIVANYATSTIGVFLGYENGMFEKITVYPLGYGSHLFFTIVGDFDNDRKLDFAAANNGTDSLNAFLQTC